MRRINVIKALWRERESEREREIERERERERERKRAQRGPAIPRVSVTDPAWVSIN